MKSLEVTVPFKRSNFACMQNMLQLTYYKAILAIWFWNTDNLCYHLTRYLSFLNFTMFAHRNLGLVRWQVTAFQIRASFGTSYIMTLWVYFWNLISRVASAFESQEFSDDFSSTSLILKGDFTTAWYPYITFHGPIFHH